MRASEGSEPAKADCEDPIIKAACLLESDECPAECKGDAEKEDSEVVKSGSLAVSSSAAEDRSVVVAEKAYAVSDLDTLTFKTSEEVEISRITLEKYGFSNAGGTINKVWLEDENGKEVTTKASPNTKGLVNLSVKKDYKTVDGKFNATIVVETKSVEDGAVAGGTLGFKVKEVSSTAKDVDLGDYKAYKYDVVRYDGSVAEISAKGGEKDHNYESGKSYEVSKFKIKAPDDSAIIVSSFTLKDEGDMDISDNFDELEVSVDGKTVKANIDVDKKEKVTVSFKDPIEIAAKQKIEIIVSTTLNSDFDSYGKTVQLVFENVSDLSATDKNNARITINDIANYVTYTFKGGKVKISSTKLGNVESAINSTDVLIASGEITVSEAIEGKLKVTASDYADSIETMRLEIAGDEIDGTLKGTTWTFDNIEVTESGKIKLYVDLTDKNEGKTITFSIDGWDNFTYSEGTSYNEKTGAGDKVDISGSLNISKLILNKAQGTLTNTLSTTDDVEFPNKEVNTFTVLEGKYTAKKQNINLNSFTIKGTNDSASKVRFYLYVDDMKDSVADVKLDPKATEQEVADTFNDILVKAGESVNVKVEAEIDAKEALDDVTTSKVIGKFKVILDGEDENDNPNGGADKNTARIVIVKKGSVSISDTSVAAKAVLRKASESKIAEVTVKPDGANSVTVESVSFDLAFTKNAGAEDFDGEVKLYVDGSNETLTAKDGHYTAECNKPADKDGIVVRIELDGEFDGTVDVTKLYINDTLVKKDFSKKFVEAVVWFTSQESTSSRTSFKLGLDKKDSASVENLSIHIKGGEVDKWVPINELAEIKAGTYYDVNNEKDAADVIGIKYTINGGGAKEAVAATCKLNGGESVAAGEASEEACKALAVYTPAVADPETPATCKLNGGESVAAGEASAEACKALAVYTAGSDAVEASYITYASADFPDMFRIGMKEDGKKVFVEKKSNN